MAKNPVRARTPWFIKNVLNPIFSLTGAFPVVAVRGRRTGRLLRTPVNVLELDGARYLVSPRGETGWASNLRVSRECTLTIKGREQRFRAAEVPPAERPRLIAAYLQRWGGQTRGQFEALPDPADHPTFRLDPA
ncbi:MAG TPA: nitroreductase/quinone reductase family protein [Chloroflexota bacterium]|nr:nitroreductase/quinone reductase family protein [Chloroflexota bacterium]